jgi:hypothetical protein
VIGKVFKKDAKAIMDALTTMPADLLHALEKSLTDKG